MQTWCKINTTILSCYQLLLFPSITTALSVALCSLDALLRSEAFPLLEQACSWDKHRGLYKLLLRLMCFWLSWIYGKVGEKWLLMIKGEILALTEERFLGLPYGLPVASCCLSGFWRSLLQRALGSQGYWQDGAAWTAESGLRAHGAIKQGQCSLSAWKGDGPGHLKSPLLIVQGWRLEPFSVAVVLTS